MCSSGLVSLGARLEVDALCAQDCGSREDWHTEVNDTLWKHKGGFIPMSCLI